MKGQKMKGKPEGGIRGATVTATQAETLPCQCGNQTHTGGFYPCKFGFYPCKLEGDLRPTWTECEPEGDWAGHYMCADCGRISAIAASEEE